MLTHPTVLREQLLSQVNTSNNVRDQNEMQTSSPASPNDNSLDHNMGGSGMMSASAGSDDGNDNDGRKGYGKRELSTSKRAAQNRAAQVSQHFALLQSQGTLVGTVDVLPKHLDCSPINTANFNFL